MTSAGPGHGHAADKAYRWIRARILGNAWPPGARLGEADLSARIGVSRTPVREALRRLTAEGLLESAPNQGARIRQWSAADLEEIYGLRIVLETYAARLAAQRMDAGQLAELRALCESMERVVDDARRGRTAIDALGPLNERFHLAIARGARDGRLRSLVENILSLPLALRTFGAYDAAEVRRSMAHHREIAEAIAARDPEWAASVMHAHVSAGHHALRRALDEAVAADTGTGGRRVG